MAEGPLLHLIDAETLFQSNATAACVPEDLWGASSTPLTDSVLRVGLLPVWLLGGKRQTAYDISALGADSVTAPTHVPGWAHINTDDMVWTDVVSESRQPSSLSIPAGKPNPLADHAAAVEAGFEEVYRLTMQDICRERLLALVDAFAGATRRIVLRATRVYSILHQNALSAAALADANTRAFIFEQLSRNSLLAAEKGPAWQVFLAELHDMENLDIPYFDYPLGSHRVNAATGPIEGLLAGDGLAEAARRISGLSDRDLSWQKQLIRGAIHARYLTPDRSNEASMAVVGTLPSEVGAGWGELSAHLFMELERSAIDDGNGQRSWLTLSRLPDGARFQLGLIGDGLYDGRAGLVVFQLMMAELRGDSSLFSVAKSTLATLHERWHQAEAYSRFRYLRDFGLGWSGIGGVLRLLRSPWVVRSGAKTGDLRTQFDDLLAEVSSELIQRDRHRDFMGGVAGLIGPVAGRHQEAPSEQSAAILRAAATRLVSAQRDDGGWDSEEAKRPLTGLAHGASGMGLALMEAGVALFDATLIDAGVRAFEYERGVFDERVGNWPDFRDHPELPDNGAAFVVAWCHGAPGIGLARLRALELLPDHPKASVWRRELDRAMHATACTPLADSDHLCCGNLGRAAVLHIAGLGTGNAGWVADADALTRQVVARARSRGGFALAHGDPGSTGASSPGLMTGIAGIGAHLATLALGTDLASALL